MTRRVSDDVVAAIVNEHHSRHDDDALWEAYLVAVTDRTIDVVAVIREPFSFRDVAQCVDRVLAADGWVLPGYLAHRYVDIRPTMADLEDAQQIVRVRAGAGPRPHLFVRTHSRRHYPDAARS